MTEQRTRYEISGKPPQPPAPEKVRVFLGELAGPLADAADDNRTTISKEIRSRVIRTLIEDGYMKPDGRG